jgi:hypothetical protein
VGVADATIPSTVADDEKTVGRVPAVLVVAIGATTVIVSPLDRAPIALVSKVTI